MNSARGPSARGFDITIVLVFTAALLTGCGARGGATRGTGTAAPDSSSVAAAPTSTSTASGTIAPTGVPPDCSIIDPSPANAIHGWDAQRSQVQSHLYDGGTTNPWYSCGIPRFDSEGNRVEYIEIYLHPGWDDSEKMKQYMKWPGGMTQSEASSAERLLNIGDEAYGFVPGVGTSDGPYLVWARRGKATINLHFEHSQGISLGQARTVLSEIARRALSQT